MELEVRLPLQPYFRRFLRGIGLAPAQISPNGWRVLINMWSLWRVLGIETDPSFAKIQHCYKLAPCTRGGDGWWYLASWTKQAGEGFITGLPTSNKEWKKTWFIATDCGRELTLGGRPMRVRSVFGFPAVWERVHENQLTPDEHRHVAAAWKAHSRERHVNHLLGDRLLSSLGFIPVPTALRLSNAARSKGKKEKLVGKPRGMVSSRADKGKALMGAKKSRVMSKSSRGSKIPDDFLKTIPSKRTRASMETSTTDCPEEGMAEDVRPLKVRPPRFKEVSSEAGGGFGGYQSPSEERVRG
ncbi:hypothetical protein ACOSP7_018430 [Xanthoceras sorbifolium]